MSCSRGAFCISIDLELAWGVWDQLSAEYVDKCLELERTIVKRILTIFERHEIPATWAIVGHLLQKRDDCSPNELPAWYAPEIIDWLCRAKPEQEIGSHSFGHIYFSEVSAVEASADLSAARAIHQRSGVAFDSFVFPRNKVAHLDVLSAAGLKVFRGADHGWHMGVSPQSLIGRAAHLIDTVLPLKPAVVRPTPHPSGLVELPGSMLLMGRNGLRRLVRPAALRMKARRALREAADKNSVFHLWFHPSNFYHATESQFGVLESIVEYAASLRARERLDIVPMGHFNAPARSARTFSSPIR